MRHIKSNNIAETFSIAILAVSLFPAQLAGQSVEEFVQRTFIHGVPYEKARHFDSSAIDQLRQLLRDSSYERAWTNIVYTIGYAADGTTGAELLISFIERGEGTIGRDAERAKRHSLIALGYLIARTGNEAGLIYLIESLDPETWTQRNLGWRSSSVGLNQLRQRLIAAAIQGLGVTGTERAELAMQAGPWQAHVSGSAASELQEVVETAMRTNRKIRSIGVQSYLRNRRQR